MTLADIGANFIEPIVRHEMSLTYFQEVFNRILAVGLIRSIITFTLYWLIEGIEFLYCVKNIKSVMRTLNLLSN